MVPVIKYPPTHVWYYPICTIQEDCGIQSKAPSASRLQRETGNPPALQYAITSCTKAVTILVLLCGINPNW